MAGVVDTGRSVAVGQWARSATSGHWGSPRELPVSGRSPQPPKRYAVHARRGGRATRVASGAAAGSRPDRVTCSRNAARLQRLMAVGLARRRRRRWGAPGCAMLAPWVHCSRDAAQPIGASRSGRSSTTCRDSFGRRRRVLPADGHRRERHARGAQGPPRTVRRSRGRRARRADRQHGGRRPAAGVPERGGRHPLRGKNPGRRWKAPSARYGSPPMTR